MGNGEKEHFSEPIIHSRLWLMGRMQMRCFDKLVRYL
jgi:hypothetical protein